MNTKALCGVVILGMVTSLFVACGDGDSTKIETCSPRKVTCLNDKNGEVCGSDGTVNQPFTCDEGEVCGTDEDGTTGCLGGCEAGEKECASEAISRVCSDDGKTWIPVACEPGTGCDGNQETEDGEPNPDYGTCARSDDPTVTVCTREQTTCADGRTVKACENDGSNWVYTPCLANEQCAEGVCVVDPDKKCTPNTGTCVDATHVKKCADSGEAYDEPTACPTGTTCSDGACRGPVCTVGEVRCDDVRDGNVFDALSRGSYQSRAVYTCVDGASWEVTECEQTEVCAYTDISSTAVNQYIEDLKSSARNSENRPVFDVPESSRATCQTPECAAPFAFRELLTGSFYSGLFFGSYACGDAADPDSTFIDSFSLCEGLPPYNNLHWANYTCPDGTECSYVENVSQTTGSSQSPVCTSTCTEGDVRCFDTFGESTITCHDGEWDPNSVEPCRDGTREQWCRRNVTATGTNYTQATCQDPACVVWQDEFETFLVPPGYGACGDDGKFYQCLPDGTMDRGVDCPTCVRSIIRAPGISLPPNDQQSHFAGYHPGYCVDECTDGEQMCISIQSAQPSPFYYECDNGHWTTVASCPNGEACRDFPRTAETPRQIICGGVCFPGQTACVDGDGNLGGELITNCNENGEWGEPTACDRGICTEDDQQAAGVAACEDECIPGTKSCESGGEVTCSRDARFSDPEPCATGTICLFDSPSLSRLGCIECIPRDPANPSSVSDSRCEDAQLQVCGPDGTWASGVGTTCPGGCTGAEAGNTTPGSRATCLPFTGGGGQAGSGGSTGRAGGGAGGRAGSGGSGGLPPIGGFAGIGIDG